MIDSEELRDVRFAICQKVQYINLELQRIGRLLEYKGKRFRNDARHKRWKPSLPLGFNVPPDNGERIVKEFKDKYGDQLHTVMAIGLSVSKGYHMIENGVLGGLKWTDDLFQGNDVDWG
jgi:hypothetical protein